VHDCGIGTFILMMILLGAMLINEYRKGNMIWDTSSWMLRQKSSADETAERLRKYSNDNYNISWRDRQ
jgi:hypothetical protein